MSIILIPLLLMLHGLYCNSIVDLLCINLLCNIINLDNIKAHL